MDISPDIITLAGVLLATGCLAGFSAGLFGIGGGAVMVPALYYVFSALGYPESTVMHTAVATSSAVIIISSIRSVMSHHSHKAVDWAVLWPSQKIKSWGLWIGLGALLASAVLAKYISGIGGGAISVTLMVICGKTIHRAIGTASGVGMFISIPATLGFILSGWGVAQRAPLSLGYVNILGFILVALTSILFIPLGARTAHNTDQQKLKTIFGAFLILVSINMIRKTLF